MNNRRLEAEVRHHDLRFRIPVLCPGNTTMAELKQLVYEVLLETHPEPVFGLANYHIPYISYRRGGLDARAPDRYTVQDLFPNNSKIYAVTAAGPGPAGGGDGDGDGA
ncbi:hypothetical protein BGX34_006040 [Mortierella sp. NVP85]|nr:hypothetical protein BGX34_006040 [Mortierella sp. NVP85]